MTKKNTSGKTVIVWAVFAALAAIFATSVYYRLAHPNMRVQSQVQQVAPQGMPPASGEGMPPGMGQGQGAPDMDQMMGQMTHVRDLMVKVDEGTATKDDLLELAQTFMMMNAWDRALIYAEQAAGLAPEDPETRRAFAVCLYQLDRYDDAVTQFEAILAMNPDDSLAHINLGIILKHALQRPDDADAQFQAVIDSPSATQELKDRALQEMES